MSVANLEPERQRLGLLGQLVAERRAGREVSDAQRRRLAALQARVRRGRQRSPWRELVEEHALDDLEQDILACVLAPETDAGIGMLYHSLQPAGAFASPALIRDLLFLDDHEGEGLQQRLAEQAPLRRRDLVSCERLDAYQPLRAGATALARLMGRGEAVTLPGALALPVEAEWETLVLPAHARRRIETFLLWVTQAERVYGDWGARAMGGPVALFAGPPGTGKTFAAEAIARRLGWPLYRVDLGLLVSKYIGETEKNLNRLFDAAAGRRAVLLFDEADSLFGRRGEVSDARDRYANMEVSHLLARIERHRGPCILTTNQRQHLDPAFIRRFQTVIEFPRPDRAARRRLWRGLLPPRAPLASDLDVDRLAEVGLTGGQIRNAATHAAFLAAGRDGELGMPALAEAVWHELGKDGRDTPREALGPLQALLGEMP